MDRRAFIGTLAAGLAGPAAAATTAPLALVLLGQALIQHDVCGQSWPGRGGIRRALAGADVVFTDLETALLTPQAGPPTRDPLLLHAAPPETLDCLRSLGVNLVATANNHAWDLGASGIVGLEEPLRRRGLAFAGTGTDLPSAAAPAVVMTPRGRVALVAFASGAIRDGAAATAQRPGVNELRREASGELNSEDLARVLDAVSRAARQADVVLACHHNHLWEPDNAVTPPWQKALARQLIDAGAGVFVSHGAPLLQGLELYRGRPIFYDLGNFLFQTRTPDDRYGPDAWESLIARCEFRDGRFVGAELVPVRLNATGAGGPGDMETRGRPELASPAAARRILERIAQRSRADGVRLSLNGDRAVWRP